MEVNRFGDLFWETFPNSFFLSMVLGALTGIANSLMVPLVMYAISTDVDTALVDARTDLSFFTSPTFDLGKVFALVCLFIVLLRGASSALAAYVTRRAATEHRLWLYRRIQNIRLSDLEKIGQPRLINILNVDVPAITNAATALPSICISIITVLGVLAYLVHINIKVFGFVMICVIIAVMTYQLPLFFANRFFSRARDGYDRVQQGVKGLVFGAKELKLNRERAEAYYQNELFGTETIAVKDGLKGNTLVVFAQSYGDVLSFLIVGIVVFHYRYTFDLANNELLSLVMALLYLTGPIGQIMTATGNIQQGKVSLTKLRAFYRELNDEVVGASDAVESDWDKISLEKLCYHYTSRMGDFSLTDVSLEFKRGQITFIVGGNGSGKSTLGKCLAFLYFPTSGKVYLGGNIVAGNNLVSCRQLVSAVFPDYFLFKRLYGISTLGSDVVDKYLAYLELSEKVAIIGNEFTTLDLSEGQRKRLALLVMLIENRDICIFDEWAADQDPKFKEIFYSVILPDLRRKRKVVIVITHDDRYFDCADQVVFMEAGRVQRCERKRLALDGEELTSAAEYAVSR